MRVNESHAAAAGAAELNRNQQVESAGGNRTAATPAGSADDRVQVSDLSSMLLQVLNSESPDRSARLDRLRADFEAGRYEPDPAETARRMVSEALKQG